MAKLLFSALNNHHLDVDYWLEILKTKCGVTDYGQLQYIDIPIFEELKKSIRHSWEANALKKLLGLESAHEDFQTSRKEEKEEMQDAGQKRADELVKGKEEHLREMLNVPKEDWNKRLEGVNLDEVLSKFKDTFGKPDQSVINRRDRSELLEKASGGLAMKGILITNEKDCSEVRGVAIEVPKCVNLKTSKQKESVFKFTSCHQSDDFQKSLDIMGHSVAASANGVFVGFQAEAGISKKSEKKGETESENHVNETYLFREKYAYVPTAVCELDPLTLKLSETVLTELGKLELLIEGPESEIAIRDECEAFLKTYGSHINVGMLEFGGVYECIGRYSSVTKTEDETIKNPDESELSKVSLEVTMKGGPQEVSGSFPDWKKGLLQNNSTWSIIDRGYDFRKDFVGIWQLIHNHTNHFTNGGKLAQTLEHTWQLMRDEVLERIESLNSLLEQIPEWILDDKLSSNAREYLQKLLNQVEQTCSNTMERKYWVEKLNNDKHISEFFMCIINLEKQYPPHHLPHIKDKLGKLTSGGGQKDFPNRNTILNWVEICPTNTYIPCILRFGALHDIPSLIEAVTKTLLPAMQTAQVEAKVAEKTGDEIDTQATSDLALAIDHLRSQMENSGKQYEIFLLLVALKELTFDPSKKSFDVLLTEYKLRQFIQRMKDIWKEFESFRGTGDMELQAFLIQILVSSMSSIEDPLHKEQQFTEALEIIQNLLTPQVNLVILLFANKTSYDWEKLSTTLGELVHGNQENLYSQAKAKAYNSLEDKYYKLTANVDAYIVKWLNKTAIMQLERCKTNEELESCCTKLLTELEIEVSNLHKEASETLQKFFEKSDLRDIIIQWEPEKKESLNNDLKNLCDQTKQEIREEKDSIDPGQKEKQRKLEEEILNKAKTVADQMKGNDATDDELLANFDQWLIERGTKIEMIETTKKLDRYKTTAKKVIKNMVNRSTKEVIAADLLCGKLEELANKTVKRNVIGKVQDDIRSSLAHLKHSLMITIMGDLAQKDSFQNYMLFVNNAKNYALKWITAFTNDRWFSSKHGGRSLYASHAEKIIHKIRESIEKSIGVATEKQLPKGCIKTWGKEFCGALTELPLKEEDLKHMMEQDVEDFGNLERILMDRLLELEERILSPFTKETAETIEWGERKTPYTQIIDKLWGCEAQCPFCTEPCERTDPSHATKGINHQCIQHRPSGVVGISWVHSQSLAIESCNYQVQNKGSTFRCGACRFECRKSAHCSTQGGDWCNHSFIEYKTYLPEWDISPSPNMESSKYWMWFMVKYQHQLKKKHTADLAIPEPWNDITVKQAIDSLLVYRI